MQEELHRRVTRWLADDAELRTLLQEIEGKAAEPYAEAMRLLDDGGLGWVMRDDL